MAPAQVIESKDLPPEVIGVVEMSGKLPIPMPFNQASVPTVTPQAEERIHTETAVTASFHVPTAKEIAISRDWESELASEALSLLATDRHDVWDVLTQRFESCLIQAALSTTRGRRIEAALKLGIGRNTITRKIQELGIED
jgi:two-component system nitrogen regulation response regulator GlnG